MSIILAISRLIIHLSITTLFLVFFLFVANGVNAHPGNTDSSGCHTCRTNCPSWGRSYGEYHCHNPKPNYGSGTYNPGSRFFETRPTCPLFSTYNSLTQNCECNYGYVVRGGKCISTSQYCRDEMGFMARYNSLTDACECTVGNIIDPITGDCTSANIYCSREYGTSARFNSLTDKCECSYGYEFYGGKCASLTSICESKYGFGAQYNSLYDQCECEAGYFMDDDLQCLLGSTLCSEKYGLFADYDHISEECECKSGYALSNDLGKCISENEFCEELFGYYSQYDNLLDSCVCRDGYIVEDETCVEQESSPSDFDSEIEKVLGSEAKENFTADSDLEEYRIEDGNQAEDFEKSFIRYILDLISDYLGLEE